MVYKHFLPLPPPSHPTFTSGVYEKVLSSHWSHTDVSTSPHFALPPLNITNHLNRPLKSAKLPSFPTPLPVCSPPLSSWCMAHIEACYTSDTFVTHMSMCWYASISVLFFWYFVSKTFLQDLGSLPSVLKALSIVSKHPISSLSQIIKHSVGFLSYLIFHYIFTFVYHCMISVN